ncbi:MAG: hypothetical protein V1918_06530 [Planctomycetota bacterium]
MAPKRQSQGTIGAYRAALKRLAADPPPALVVVLGGQEYFRRRAVEACVRAVRKARPSLDVVTFHGPAAQNEAPLPEESVLAELRNRGLFVPHKLVIVRRADRFLFPSVRSEADSPEEKAAEPLPRGRRRPKALLADYVKAPTPGVYLFFECESLDRRGALGKALSAHGLVIPCPALRWEEETTAWLRDEARGRGYKLTLPAASVLFAAWGPEPGVLSSEIEKLALYAGDDVTLGEDTIRTFVGESLALNLFELTNAVEARDREKALAVARRLSRQGLSDARGRRLDPMAAVHIALGSLRSCLGEIWIAHDLAARGGTVRDLESRLGPRGKRALFLQAAARRYSLREIRAALNALAEGLASLHDVGSDPALTLERTVLAVATGGQDA